jgi:hypothetical protein
MTFNSKTILQQFNNKVDEEWGSETGIEQFKENEQQKMKIVNLNQ